MRARLLSDRTPAPARFSVLLAAALAVSFVAPNRAEAADKKDTNTDCSKGAKKDAKGKDCPKDVETSTPTPSPDEFKEQDDGDTTPDPKRLDKADTQDNTDPDKKDDDNYSDPGKGDQLNFTDENEQNAVKPKGPGEDTAQIYRDFQKKVSELNADEEQIKWEEYLNKYPNSMFKDRIQSRMDDLSNAMYGERIKGPNDTAVDAKDKEIQFATGWHLMGPDPRSKISAGFEIGIPSWFGLHGDFEYQILRSFSAHAGVDHGLGGWEIKGGAKYSLIKSARTNTILTAAVDLGLETAPANLYPTVSPTIAFGQRFKVLNGLDVCAQVSLVPEFHQPLTSRYLGGVSAELRANDTVYAFVESAVNLSPVDSGQSSPKLFSFDTASFGLRFVPTKHVQDNGSGKAEIGLGANIPYYHDYWSLYQGAVNADVNYYL